MKKYVIAFVATLGAAVFAADFVNVDVDHVKDRVSGQVSNAQYVRAGKEIGGIQYGLQSRTARYNDGSGMYNSLELTGGKNIGGFTPYVGWGFDNGKNGVGRYDYGLVGAQYGAKAGPGFALAGVKTRVNVKDDAPQQTVWYAGYSVPVAKDTSVGVNVSRSQQDIKEKAIGLGVTVRF